MASDDHVRDSVHCVSGCWHSLAANPGCFRLGSYQTQGAGPSGTCHVATTLIRYYFRKCNIKYHTDLNSPWDSP